MELSRLPLVTSCGPIPLWNCPSYVLHHLSIKDLT
uniref:Uncharacterized protein n=1 Tax=Arundo donax TaxID=35708 RepID=A0A0A9H6Z3_ARUDO